MTIHDKTLGRIEVFDVPMPDGVREDGTVHDSLNHYAFGAVAGWLLDSVCGIRLTAGKLTLCPHPHPSLGFARGEWNSPVGRIACGWAYEDGALTVTAEIPANLTAEIQLPDGRQVSAGPGEHRYAVSLNNN